MRARRARVARGSATVTSFPSAFLTLTEYLGWPGVAAMLPLAPAVLGPCRDRIDAIDAELLRLLEARVALALCIGEAKRAAGLPVHVPEREADVIARAEGAARLDAALAGRLFTAIVAESREAQRRLAV